MLAAESSWPEERSQIAVQQLTGEGFNVTSSFWQCGTTLRRGSVWSRPPSGPSAPAAVGWVFPLESPTRTHSASWRGRPESAPSGSASAWHSPPRWIKTSWDHPWNIWKTSQWKLDDYAAFRVLWAEIISVVLFRKLYGADLLSSVLVAGRHLFKYSSPPPAFLPSNCPQLGPVCVLKRPGKYRVYISPPAGHKLGALLLGSDASRNWRSSDVKAIN